MDGDHVPGAGIRKTGHRRRSNVVTYVSRPSKHVIYVTGVGFRRQLIDVCVRSD